MSKDKQVICANLDCEVATSGKCLEAFTNLNECPHYNQTISKSSLPTEDTKKKSRSEIAINSGEALNCKEAGKLLCARPARVITVIGLSDAGKTTLISGLYDVLQKGPFADFSFIESKTLPAFELRCHHARAVSRRTVPDTERSTRGMGLIFLHLAVTNDSGGRIDLLLSDRSGENYEAATNNTQACLELLEVYRSDLVLILADGAKLANPEFRHSTVADVRRLIEALLDSNMLGRKHRVALILTKYDKLVPNNQDGLDAFDGLANIVAEKLSNQVSEFTVIKTAARPDSPSMEAGTGLNEIFRECMKLPIIQLEQAQSLTEPKRAFHKHKAP